MTTLADSVRAASLRRVGAVARLRARRQIRSRRLLLAALMALLPWLAIDAAQLLPRIAALTEFTIVGATVLVAGALADDLDGGQYAIALTHDCLPLDALLGELIAGLVLSLLLVLLGLPFVLQAVTVARIGALLLCLVWLVALVAGWVSLMLLLATTLHGVGNGVAMIPLIFALPILSSATILGRLPAQLAGVARFALQLVPAPQQAGRMYEAILLGAAAPRIAAYALLAGPFVYFTVAAARLARIEPAGRIAA
ncbi:MAG TPA: hypothetical protein VF761_12750 [Gemmatimonadaceae bacterium]